MGICSVLPYSLNCGTNSSVVKFRFWTELMMMRTQRTHEKRKQSRLRWEIATASRQGAGGSVQKLPFKAAAAYVSVGMSNLFLAKRINLACHAVVCWLRYATQNYGAAPMVHERYAQYSAPGSRPESPWWRSQWQVCNDKVGAEQHCTDAWFDMQVFATRSACARSISGTLSTAKTCLFADKQCRLIGCEVDSECTKASMYWQVRVYVSLLLNDMSDLTGSAQLMVNAHVCGRNECEKLPERELMKRVCAMVCIQLKRFQSMLYLCEQFKAWIFPVHAYDAPPNTQWAPQWRIFSTEWTWRMF